MILELQPIAALPGQPASVIAVAGDTITVDGVAYDLSPVQDGDVARPGGDHPFVGDITRTGGRIRCALLCRYDARAAAPDQPADPAHWRVEAADGPVALPLIPRDTTPEETPA